MNRISRLIALMRDYQISAVAVNAGPDLKYLSGLDFHLSERPAILILTSSGKNAFIFPEFEKDKVQQAGIPLQAFSYGEDPRSWRNTAKDAFTFLQLSNMKIAVSPMSFRFLELDFLQQANASINIVSGEALFQNLYDQKDAEEITNIRQAVKIAEEALMNTLDFIKPGRSEKEITNQLVIHLLKSGCDAELPFSPIVAAGPNSANPHANPSDRKLQSGDLLIIDWGARYQGYVSDITRTFAVGSIPKPFTEIAEIVHTANNTARQTLQPGITASVVDSAAREVISRAGYADNFLHRTGHGIGLQAHEEPYISQTSMTTLKSGMLFTIEPGIYLTGQGGVRIEDDVLVTEDGSETLTSLPRELKVL